MAALHISDTFALHISGTISLHTSDTSTGVQVKPKARPQMSQDHILLLSETLEEMDEADMEGLAEILRRTTPYKHVQDEDFELDLELLNNEELWSLEDYVKQVSSQLYDLTLALAAICIDLSMSMWMRPICKSLHTYRHMAAWRCAAKAAEAGVLRLALPTHLTEHSERAERQLCAACIDSRPLSQMCDSE
jgi:hypothetical protein